MKLAHLNLPVPFHPSMEVLDSTKVQCYQSCPRLFFYEYVLGWRSARPNNHLWFGQCVHKAMETLVENSYTADVVIKVLETFENEYRSKFPKDTDAIFTPKTPERFFAMLLEYIVKYADDLQKYRLYKAEIGGIVPLTEHHELAFKMDTIFYDISSGKYFSLEHKTKGGYIGMNYATDFELSIQVGTYTHVLNCLFPRDQVKGITINCMAFKKTKKASFELERFPILLSDAQMSLWLNNTVAWMDRIEEDFQSLAAQTPADSHLHCFPLNGRSCSNWGRVCTYHDMCTIWNNPLAHLDSMPVDFEVFFWNPLEEELNETFDFRTTEEPNPLET